MNLALRTLGWGLLVANFLDVTTSLIASPADLSFPVPGRRPIEWAAQLALVALLLGLLAPRLPRVVEAWKRASRSVPRPALIVTSLFVGIELAHIALRLETFPFTPVAMYSNAVAVPTPAVKARWAFVIPSPQGHQILSQERESTFMRQFLRDFDYRMAAAVTMYTRSSVVYRMIHERVVEAGHAPPVLVQFRYDAWTGKIIPGPSRSIPLPEAETQR